MRGVYYRTKKDGTPLATPELRISATNNRTVYYDNQNAKEAALQNDEIKEGSIVLTGYADGESEVLIKQEIDWERVQSFTAQQLFDEYIAPENGVVYITGRCATATASWITINHQKVGYYFGGSGGIVDCQVDSQVNKGDVITSSNLLTADYSGIFVPFKTVAEPLTLPVNVMNNPSLPDYSRAVAITSAQLLSGYTCPSNGMLVGVAWKDNKSDELMFLKINGVIIAGSMFSTSNDRTFANIQMPVEGGDVLTLTGTTVVSSNLSFMPYKA